VPQEVGELLALLADCREQVTVLEIVSVVPIVVGITGPNVSGSAHRRRRTDGLVVPFRPQSDRINDG
jgi:hypothetical protein